MTKHIVGLGRYTPARCSAAAKPMIGSTFSPPPAHAASACKYPICGFYNSNRKGQCQYTAGFAAARPSGGDSAIDINACAKYTHEDLMRIQGSHGFRW